MLFMQYNLQLDVNKRYLFNQVFPTLLRSCTPSAFRQMSMYLKFLVKKKNKMTKSTELLL